jgi:zinc protease
VVVVGDVQERALLSAVRDAYGTIPDQPIPPEDIAPEPTQNEERQIELHKPSASEKLLVAFKGPALGDRDHALLTVLSEVLFGGRASRLYRSLVVDRELAIDVRGWVSTFRDPGLFECWVTARESRTAAEILPVLDEALSRVKADVVGEDELARAKARLELGSLQQLETASGKAEQIGFFEVVLGEPAHPFRRVDSFRRATVADLRRVARRYLVREARTVLRVIPERPTAEAAQ